MVRRNIGSDTKMSKRYTEAELQELLNDKARLDWLANVNNSIGNVLLPRDIVERNLGSLRAGIDEAMLIDMTGNYED